MISKTAKDYFFCQIVFLRTLFIGLNLVGFIEPKVKKLWAATVRIDGFLLHMLGFFSRSFPLSFIFHFLSHFFPLRLHIFACFYTSGKLLGPGATVVMMRKLMLLFLFMLWFPTLNYQWGWNRWSYHQPIFLLLGILVILVGPDRFILRRSL